MRPKAIVAALSLVVVAACDNATPTETSPDLDVTNASTKTSTVIDGHLRAAPRFAIDLKVLNAPRLGAPIHLRASTTADVSTAEVELTLSLPELALAQDSSWKINRSSSAVVSGARSAKRRALARGALDIRDTSVVVERPGIYRVVASAIASSNESARVAGQLVQDAAHAELWLLVDSTGSRVLNDYDAAAIPEKYVATPGQFRLRRPTIAGGPRQTSAARVAPETTRPSSTTGVQSSSSLTYGNRRLVYYDYDTYSYRGVPQAVVTWQFYDIQYGGPTNGGSAQTDENGYFQGACPYYYEYATGPIGYTNTRIEAAEGVMVADQYYEGHGGDCESYYEQVMPSTASRVYHRMTEVANNSGLIFGYYRPKLTVEVRPVGISRYESGYDKIVLERPTTSGTNLVDLGGVWGQLGRFTMGHEYGHAAHEKAFGGMVINPNCPAGHSLESSTGNYNCAFNEGFANYHAIETVGSAMGYFYTNFVTNFYYDTGTDGGTWSGPVGSALWYLARSSSLNGAFTANYYARLLRGGCLVTVPGDFFGFVKPQGIDHMIYCLERQAPVSSSLQSTYFGARNPTFSISWNISAPSNQPTQSAIRAVWGTYLRGTSNIVVP